MSLFYMNKTKWGVSIAILHFIWLRQVSLLIIEGIFHGFNREADCPGWHHIH